MRMPKPHEQAICRDCERPSRIGENGENVCNCGGRLDLLNEVHLTMTDSQALALAQFAKRVGWQEFRANAVDDAEAYAIRHAVDLLAKALSAAGFEPR